MSKFDEMFDITEILEEIAENEAKSAPKEWKDVPEGTWNVGIVHGELRESKAGNPMVSFRFRVLDDGEYKGQTIFYNQVVTKGFQMQIVYRLFGDLGFPGKFASYSQLEDDIKEIVDNQSEFLLEYGTNDKGFNTYKVLDVFK